jgi:hypothetical protein
MIEKNSRYYRRNPHGHSRAHEIIADKHGYGVEQPPILYRMRRAERTCGRSTYAMTA